MATISIPERLVYAPPQLTGGAAPSEGVGRAVWRWLMALGPVLAILVLSAVLLLRGERWARRLFDLPYGDELLLEATMNGDVAGIKHALCEGASPNAETYSCTALMSAVCNGDEASATCLIEAGARVNETLGAGKTALTDAAWGGRKRMIKLLLDHGADPNAYGPRVGTPLYAAVVTNHEDVVELLLARGADPNLPLADGTTPLDVAQNGTDIAPSIRARLVAAGARRSARTA